MVYVLPAPVCVCACVCACMYDDCGREEVQVVRLQHNVRLSHTRICVHVCACVRACVLRSQGTQRGCVVAWCVLECWSPVGEQQCTVTRAHMLVPIICELSCKEYKKRMILFIICNK